MSNDHLAGRRHVLRTQLQRTRVGPDHLNFAGDRLIVNDAVGTANSEIRKGRQPGPQVLSAPSLVVMGASIAVRPMTKSSAKNSTKASGWCLSDVASRASSNLSSACLSITRPRINVAASRSILPGAPDQLSEIAKSM